MNVRGYGRRSDDDQSAYSPPAQARACEAWARAGGHEWKGWYFDDDLSGKREDRPQLLELLRVAQADPGSIVIVHKFDRLNRDTEALLRIVYKVLLPKRVQVHSVSEIFDPYTPLGKVMLTIGGSVSTYHIDNLSTEVKKGLREKAERGGWIGLTPFGYRSVHQFAPNGERIRGTHQIVPSDDADTVREIFALYASGNHSFITIAQHLADRGLELLHPKTHLRVPWNADAIRGLLHNPAYIGQVSCAGQPYQGQHEPLIDRALWDQVQALIERRAHGQTGRAAVRASHTLLLTELVFCAECGQPMHAHSSGNATNRNCYYRCKGRRRYGQRGCTASMARADLLDDQILDLVRQLSIAAPLAAQVIQDAQQSLRAPTRAPADTRRIQEQLRRLKAAYFAGDPDLDDRTYQRQRQALEAQLRPAEVPTSSALNVARAIELLSSMANVITVATAAERRAIIQQLVAAVWVKPGEVVAVKTQPAWAALYDAAAYEVGKATSAGLESALATWDALPAHWQAWQVAA